MVECNVIPSTLWTMTEVSASVSCRAENLVAATSRVSKKKKEKKRKNRDPPFARRPVFVRLASSPLKSTVDRLYIHSLLFLILLPFFYLYISLYIHIYIYISLFLSVSPSLILPIRIWSAIDRFVRAWDVILSMCNFLTSSVRTRMDFRCTNRGFLSESAHNFSVFSVRSFQYAKKEGKSACRGFI